MEAEREAVQKPEDSDKKAGQAEIGVSWGEAWAKAQENDCTLIPL